MRLFKIRIFYDNSTLNRTGEAAYLMQSDDIYSVKNQFLANCFTIPEGFDVAGLGDLNFRLVWDIKDGYDFVGHVNDHNVVIAVKEVIFNSPQQILFMNSNIIDMRN